MILGLSNKYKENTLIVIDSPITAKCANPLVLVRVMSPIRCSANTILFANPPDT